jgi:hypothetical protein
MFACHLQNSSGSAQMFGSTRTVKAGKCFDSEWSEDPHQSKCLVNCFKSGTSQKTCTVNSISPLLPNYLNIL